VLRAFYITDLGLIITILFQMIINVRMNVCVHMCMHVCLFVVCLSVCIASFTWDDTLRSSFQSIKARPVDLFSQTGTRKKRPTPRTGEKRPTGFGFELCKQLHEISFQV